MALRYDDLESNPFYKYLSTKYSEKFKLAQKNSWIVCVPHQSSLKGITISEEFVECHILKPSPFFKSHFATTDNQQSRSFEFDDGIIHTPTGTIRILMEELGYNEDFKPFKIFMIERPLNCPTQEKDDCKASGLSNSQRIRLSAPECKIFLESFPEHKEPLKMLEKKIRQFTSSYMVLPQYLHDAAIKLQDLISWATQVILESHETSSNFEEAMASEIVASLESYILSQVHNKIFPVIKMKCAEEDKRLTQRLYSLYEAGLTPDQLGVKEPFCCVTPSAVVELASLNSKSSPAEKLVCLKTTLELLTQDIQQSLQETYSPLRSNKVDMICMTQHTQLAKRLNFSQSMVARNKLRKEVNSLVSHKKYAPYMTSDDLIPLLVTVLVQTRPQYLGSNLYYIQNFCWQLSAKDKLSFSLVTFQAAKEFLKTSEIDYLRPSKSKIKKEMSLEELMEMTVEIQKSSRNVSAETKPHHINSPIDHQLENVTKMIEASTRELREWTQHKELHKDGNGEGQNVKAKDSKLGDFLSSLQQSSLGFSYGKQT